MLAHNGMENTLVLGDLNGRTAHIADFSLDGGGGEETMHIDLMI